MTRIERRQERLRRVRMRYQKATKVNKGDNTNSQDDITASPDMHHHMGKSQNDFEVIGQFLSRNSGDPAIKVGSYY